MNNTLKTREQMTFNEKFMDKMFNRMVDRVTKRKEQSSGETK